MSRSPQPNAPLPKAGISPGAAGTRAVFLHTGWRSGGTWLWSECRAQPGVVGFYEPLHEAASHLRRSDIARIGPGSWQSSHSDTPPYFEEYRSLISQGGRGIALYQPRFAFDSFFLEADDEDPALEAYMSALLAVPAAYNEVAVLKFCRSLGRVAWFERHFPAALHAVVVRHPVAQWQSTRRLLLEQRNRYFTLAPLLVMARNAHHPMVQEACSALGVRLPELHSPDMAYGVEKTWRVAKRYTAEQSYRAFLAFWTATSLTALSSGAMVIEAERLEAAPEYRAWVAQKMEGVIGGRLCLAARRSPMPADMTEFEAANGAAAAVVQRQADLVEAERISLLLRLLNATCATIPTTVVPHGSPPKTPSKLTLTAEVLLARTLQPLRRLHGKLSPPRT